MLAALTASGWAITGSWPIDTEMGTRLRARNSAALASSVHLVCRPRESLAGIVLADAIGDWRAVLKSCHVASMNGCPALAEEGVVGADAIFACLGPALEISRYSRVERPVAKSSSSGIPGARVGRRGARGTLHRPSRRRFRFARARRPPDCHVVMDTRKRSLRWHLSRRLADDARTRTMTSRLKVGRIRARVRRRAQDCSGAWR